MPSVLSLLRSRATLLVSACGLALMQTACAHPVMVEPSVVVHGRIGGPVYGSVYAGPLYGPPPVVVKISANTLSRKINSIITTTATERDKCGKYK